MFQKVFPNLEIGQMFPAALQGTSVKGAEGAGWEAGEAQGAHVLGRPSRALDTTCSTGHGSSKAVQGPSA